MESVKPRFSIWLEPLQVDLVYPLIRQTSCDVNLLFLQRIWGKKIGFSWKNRNFEIRFSILCSHTLCKPRTCLKCLNCPIRSLNLNIVRNGLYVLKWQRKRKKEGTFFFKIGKKQTNATIEKNALNQRHLNCFEKSEILCENVKQIRIKRAKKTNGTNIERDNGEDLG